MGGRKVRRTLVLNILLHLVCLVALLACKKSEKKTVVAELNTEVYLKDSVRVVINSLTTSFNNDQKLILYALPNGNSVEWTMGKRKLNEDDWHVDIQHVLAQTRWLRKHTRIDWTVAYLEAPKLSWSGWNRENQENLTQVAEIVDTRRSIVTNGSDNVILSSHSGGGAFINAFIETQKKIPNWVEKINFIDSNYGYHKGIGLKLKDWLLNDQQHKLVVMAYNDSIALYQGKPFVSATGGTWVRSKMMLNDLSTNFNFDKREENSLIWYRDEYDQIQIILKKNPDRSIYHTEQVELNGFVHSMLFGTEYEMKAYQYFWERVYEALIEEDWPEIIRDQKI